MACHSPGSHRASTQSETGAELRAADGNPADGDMHATHPDELLVPLTPESTLVWTPATWHATTANGPGKRRSVGWNYSAAAPTRDAAAVKLIFGDEVMEWDEARQRLWGVFEEQPEAKL